MLQVSSTFDSGNGDLVAIDGDEVRLTIRPDAGDKHLQWFHFRVAGAKGRQLRWVLTNASRASYPAGWTDYGACASYDRVHWFRVPTTYEEGELRCEHEVEGDVVWYAYFAPYDEERHQQLLGWAQEQPGVSLECLGSTLDGRAMDLLSFGAEDGVPCWIIARQHPGESMAEHLIEGLLQRLLDPSDALAASLLERARFYVVPNMNPDGSARGHLRTNAVGTNLNRAWAEPSMEASPEVFLVRERMDQTGVRFCLDVHGDEGLPYNFIAGADGVAALPDAIHRLRDRYEEVLETACPAFQRVHGYPRAAKGEANLTMATNQTAQRFGALSMTLEQPFKDDANHPDPEVGWSPAKCAALGRAQLDALAAVLDAL
ncbi:MAG: hypothetical protein CMN30_28370 [Sandaracinus sp.]|nr:hypothetical protein [Sandaracinus sp.]